MIKTPPFVKQPGMLIFNIYNNNGSIPMDTEQLNKLFKDIGRQARVKSYCKGNRPEIPHMEIELTVEEYKSLKSNGYKITI